MIPSAAAQLPLENTLAAFFQHNLDVALFPATPSAPFPFHPAHAVDKQPPDNADYLAIIAGIPDWKTLNAAGAIVRLAFQSITSVADPDQRSARAQLAQDRLGAILERFTEQNCVETLALLQTEGLAYGVGFTGWDGPAEDSQDGRTPDEKALAPLLNYTFKIYLFDI